MACGGFRTTPLGLGGDLNNSEKAGTRCSPPGASCRPERQRIHQRMGKKTKGAGLTKAAKHGRPSSSAVPSSTAILVSVSSIALAGLAGYALFGGTRSPLGAGVGSKGKAVSGERFKYSMSDTDPPYATFEKLFTDEECDAMIAFGRKQHMQDATISTGRSKNAETRRGQVGAFRHPSMTWVNERVLQAMNHANENSWQWNLTKDITSRDVEMMQFGIYDHSRKAFYDYHADNGFIGSPHENRKLSLTVQVNDIGFFRVF